MNVKKMVAIMAAGIIAAALFSSSAEAGVGGCFRNPSCSGFQSVQKPVVQISDDHNRLLDSLRWLLPNHLYTSLRTYIHRGNSGNGSGQIRTEGVGGCFFLCKL